MDQQKKEACAWLAKWLPPGTTVFTLDRTCDARRVWRKIDLFIIGTHTRLDRQGEAGEAYQRPIFITRSVASALEARIEDGSVMVRRLASDERKDLVERLSMQLHDDAGALYHEGI